MREREKKTAERFGVLEMCEKLETQLMSLQACSDVDFDLNGFYDNMNLVCVLVGYDIDVRRDDYFAARKQFLVSVIEVMLKHDLHPTVDCIEDYGEHFYFVRRCGDKWKRG